MNQRLHDRPGFLAATLPEVGAGQSLVELALILPILLLIMLGALNLGLAIRAQLQLAQLSQQAAQYLVHHPTLSDPDVGSNPPTYTHLVNYMDGLSSYQLTPLQVSVTVGTSTNPQNSSCTAAHSCVQQDTVTVHYPFPVLFPLIGKLSVGMLRSGAIQLGATASTVAATHPVSNLQVCTYIWKQRDCPIFKASKSNNGQTEISWNPPVEAGSISLPLSYCIQRVWWDTSTPSNKEHTDTYYDGTDTTAPAVTGDPPINSLNCIAGTTSGARVYFIDPRIYTGSFALGTLGLSYTITAIQADGLQSSAISGQANP